MPTFSQRIGVRPLKSALQLHEMDNDLRNGLWNACNLGILHQIAETKPYEGYTNLVHSLLQLIWADFFKLPIDTIPHSTTPLAYRTIRQYFFQADWSEVYDFVEFLASLDFPDSAEYINLCNDTLKKELSAYRLVGRQVARITNDEELQAVQHSLELGDMLKPVLSHVEASIKLLSDRKAPDYRNSIKESISAVESMCKIITGDEKATLNTALKKLEDAGVSLHITFRQALDKLYAYCGAADGIRHALLQDSAVDFDDAKYMLVSCSAFVNYLAAKATKAGLAKT